MGDDHAGAARRGGRRRREGQLIETLVTGDLAGRLHAVEEVVGRTDGPAGVEGALPDLLREGEDDLLEALARALGRRPDSEAAHRVLETLARRGGRVRVAALTALRGQTDRLETPALRAEPPPALAPAGPAAAATAPARLSVASVEPSAPAERRAAAPGEATREATGAGEAPDETAWRAPFELLLSGPTRERIAEAALALVDLTDARPAWATREALQALAGRLAMASFEHEGELQAGLARLAKGLKALS
jgi:Meckel syndrome type 1 protein